MVRVPTPWRLSKDRVWIQMLGSRPGVPSAEQVAARVDLRDQVERLPFPGDRLGALPTWRH